MKSWFKVSNKYETSLEEPESIRKFLSDFIKYIFDPELFISEILGAINIIVNLYLRVKINKLEKEQLIGMLNKQEIEKLIKRNDLIKNYPHLETQLTQNGFDLTVEKVFKFKGQGKLDFSNSEREIPEAEEIKPNKENEEDKYRWWNLKQGSYKIKTNEKINLPNNLVGFMFPRSSLLRMGAFTQNGFWDAGFEGKGEFILVVKNKSGIKLKENARINQIAFEKIDEVEQGYQGVHKNLD